MSKVQSAIFHIIRPYAKCGYVRIGPTKWDVGELGINHSDVCIKQLRRAGLRGQIPTYGNRPPRKIRIRITNAR